MLSQFQASYQRVEASLQRLSDSIAAYNPSETAAEELVAADLAVDDDIEERKRKKERYKVDRDADHCAVIKHQQNYVRLEELRRTADTLDEQIKNTIRLLADTRREIQNIPSNDDDAEERRQVSVDELLSYAKLIARTTVPPTYRKPIPAPTPAKDESKDAQITNGIATPPQGMSQDMEVGVSAGRAVKELPESRIQWIIPPDDSFVPWPQGEMLRRGVLGKIQKMLEDKIDPESVLSPEEQAEADRRKREVEERERLEEEERQKKAREEWGGYNRRQTVVDEPFNPDDL